MSPVVGVRDVERFRSAIAARLGLQFDDARVDFLSEVLRRRLDATRRDCDGYLREIGMARAGEELDALAEELTVPETYFFRNLDQFHALAEQVLPDRMLARRSTRQLRLLSAGCASGEEAYTLAIVLHERLDPTWGASVLAVDLNPSVLRKARRARYSPWSLREVPAAVEQRWFARDGRDVVLDDSIRTSVTFAQRNLAEDDPDLWPAEHYDVIFCRNVIMYFTAEGARALVGRISRALAPGGFLFLGHAETLRGLSQDFHLCHTHRTFYYERKAERGRRPAGSAPAVARLDESPPALASLLEQADTWVDAIRLATDRVQRLVEEPQPRSAARDVRADLELRPRWDLSRALELLREEHFAEALGLLDALPADASGDRDVLLLQAVLLTHAGDLVRAEGVCHRLLEIDELSAGAHYVLALCREGVGDLAGAVDRDRMACYLDPRFAMPRLHMGLLARRSGDFGRMRLELGSAVTLLEQEDASRLLLFGGGFGREALVALCRAELAAGGAVS